jgi:hypothetical protein
MSAPILRALLVVSLLGPGPLALAAELPKSEAVPLPTLLPGTVAPPGAFFPIAFHRSNRYDVWQLYAVDRQGGFRPRVIYSPYGPYYLYSGAPYLYAPTQPRDFMPYASD